MTVLKNTNLYANSTLKINTFILLSIDNNFFKTIFMTPRRSFIKSTTLASAGLFIASSFKYKSSYIGLQLYTVRDAMQQDPHGTLAKVGQIGYNSVEGATYTDSEKC